MQIIDDKGFLHIFRWHINIIDFYVLLFILCLMPIGFFAWKIMMPIIVFDKAEYEKRQIEVKEQIAGLKEIIAERDRKRDNFLKEHRRARKYFE